MSSSLELVREEISEELTRVEERLLVTEERAQQGDELATKALPYIRVMRYKLNELFKSSLTLH